MKKLTLVSLAVATFLFVGCGEDKKAATETTQAVETTQEVVAEAVEATQEVATEATEATTEAVADAVEATEEVVADAVEATEEAATAAVAAVEETTQEATEEVAEVVAEAPGKALYTTCAACHGPDGKTLALGKGAQIAGQAKADLAAKMHEYKNGTRDVTGNGMLMKGQMANLSDADIEALAEYISTF